MKLYTKGERRYTEAKNSEVLEAASDILTDLGLSPQAAVLLGMSQFAAAQEKFSIEREIKRVEQNEKSPNPNI